MLKTVGSVLCLLWIYLTQSHGCGISTHIEVGYRAREHFEGTVGGIDYQQLLMRHRDALEAGSPYPDAFYNSLCYDGIYHSIAEDTHWTPFLNVSINYIRRTYPKPWDQATEKLVVFLLGIVMHQVSDVNWHSLGIDQGFLRTMGKVNYHGSFNAAHNDGDFGGDVVNIYQLDMTYIDPEDNWYVPTADLVNIYQDFYNGNSPITAEKIENCTEWLYLGRLGEHIGVIEELFTDYAESSPFLVNQMNPYFLGGVDDMTVWTQNVWTRSIHMLDKGTHICDLPRNPIYIRCNISSAEDPVSPAWRNAPLTSADDDDVKNPGITTDIPDVTSGLYQSDVIKEYSERGVTFRPSMALQEMLKSRFQRINDVREFPPSEKARETLVASVFYTTNLNYSRLGEAMVSGDFNNDGNPDVAISAPLYGSKGNYQRGRVYVIHGMVQGLPAQNLTVEDSSDVILEGTQLNGRFGTALAVVDLNADGFRDLAVSAPQVGSQDLTYTGEVYVYLGSAGNGLRKQPDITISCPERYCNLGYTLTGSDVNGDGFRDLVIGAPFAPSGGEQRGFAAVIYGKSELNGRDTLTPDDFDWRQNGEQDYSWFGHTLHGAIVEGTRLLAVGAPNFRICDRPDCSYVQENIEAVGRVYLFRSPLSAGTPPSSILTGDLKFGQAGFTFTSGSPYGSGVVLAQASVSYATQGTVFMEPRNLTQPGLVSVHALAGDGTMSETSMVNFVGGREVARTGAAMIFADVNNDNVDDLLLAMPWRTEDVDREEGAEEGRVYVFQGGSGFPTGNFTLDCFFEETTPCLREKADIELLYGEAKSRFGRSLVTAKYGAKTQVVISAHHSNRPGRLSGLVAVFDTIA